MTKRLFLVLILMLMCPLSLWAAQDDASFIYDPKGARDPFLPLITPAGAIITQETDFMVSDMVLEGIVSDGRGRMAIINGSLVQEGGTIGLYAVQRIDADRVILLKDTEISVLQLKKEE